jgi:hypothetical protein
MVPGVPPFLDFVQRSEASQASVVIVQAAISNAGRLNGSAGICHRMKATCDFTMSVRDHTPLRFESKCTVLISAASGAMLKIARPRPLLCRVKCVRTMDVT